MQHGVFHPGHDEWHGQTVVVFTTGPRTYVGRWDAVAGGRVRMLDVAVHDEGASDESREAWVARLNKFGIPRDQDVVAVPEAEVARVVRLRDA
jgi:hypothetical protein